MITQSQVEAELNRRNYFTASATIPVTIPITTIPSTIPVSIPITTIPSTSPAKTPSVIENNIPLMLILFAGAFLLAIFPGQSEGGQSVQS